MDTAHIDRSRFIDICLVSLLAALASFFIFTNLGNQSLHPWDEAWYASISRNVLRSNNPLDLQFNQTYFWDHPPLGFYLTALSFMVFGVTELAARIPQAMLGVVSIVVTYLVGKQLHNRWTGVCAALILLSSRWFLFRSHTGNLDILLSCTQLLFFWSAITTKQHQKLWLPALAWGLAMLSKTTISITLAPLLLLAWWERHQLKKITQKELLVAIIAFALPFAPWYAYNTFAYGPKFLLRTIFEIGLRSGSAKGVSLTSFKQTMLYFQAAVHRWYSFFGLAAMAGGIWWLLHISRKNYASVRVFSWLFGYAFLVGAPYLLSAKTEIWHLIPLITPMALLTAVVITTVISRTHRLFYPLALAGVVYITANSLKAYWVEFINLPPTKSDAALISAAITDKTKPLYLTNDAFYPTIVYYADLQRPVTVIRDYEFGDLCKYGSEPFLFVTEEEFLKKTTGWTKLGQQAGLHLVEFSPETCGPDYWPKPTE